MIFANFHEFYNAFVSGGMPSLPDSFTVGGIVFNKHAYTKTSAYDAFTANEPIKIFYCASNPEETKVLTPNQDSVIQFIALVWMVNMEVLSIIPWTVEVILQPPAVSELPPPPDAPPVAEGSEKIKQDDLEDDMEKFHKEEKSEKVANDDTENRKTLLKISTKRIIGEELDVVIIGFNHGIAIRGKVDTGADMSSIHAEDIKILDTQDYDEPMVKFKYGDSVYTMPLHDKVAVQSADSKDGVEYRPVVKFDVKVHDRLLQNVNFNLNDRSDMPFKMLIGKSLLTKGSFLIDPKLEETFVWKEGVGCDANDVCMIDIDIPPPNDEPASNQPPAMDDNDMRMERLRELYEILWDTRDISFNDILAYGKINEAMLAQTKDITNDL